MKEKKHIDKFIREGLDPELVSSNFSGNVMEKIFEFESKKEKGLVTLLQKYTLENPSINFTSRIISEIQIEPKKIEYQSVISKKAWVLIALSLLSILFYILVFIDISPVSSNIVDNYLLKFENLLSFDLPHNLFSPLFAVSIFALSSLLLLDYMIRNRNYSH